MERESSSLFPISEKNLLKGGLKMAILVKNMGDPKNPWEEVPIEVLIEEERKKKERELEHNRPRIYLPIPDYPERAPTEQDEEGSEEFKIVIKL